MVRGDDGPECLLCGRRAELAPAAAATLVAERAAEANRRTHIRKVECSHCGRMFGTPGMASHQRVCGRMSPALDSTREDGRL